MESSESTILEINQLLLQCPVPLERLRHLATESPGGLQTTSCRRRVWPKLLGVDRFKASTDWRRAPKSEAAVAHQISLDVSRSLHQYEAHDAARRGARSKQQRKRQLKAWNSRRAVLQQALEALVGTNATDISTEVRAALKPTHKDAGAVAVNRDHENLATGMKEEHHYYQGLHDVVSVLLLVAGSNACTVYQWSSAVLNDFLRDASAPSFAPVLACLETLWPLLRRADPLLAKALEAADASATVVLAWVITWFAHDVKDPAAVERLFDAFLSSHPALPLYTAAALIQANRDQVLACECDFAEMHTLLVSLPRDPNLKVASVDKLLVSGCRLMRQYPPHTLPTLQGVPEEARQTLGAVRGRLSLFGANKDTTIQLPLLVRREPPACVAATTVPADVELLEQKRAAKCSSQSDNGQKGTSSTPVKASKSVRMHRRRARLAGAPLNKIPATTLSSWWKKNGARALHSYSLELFQPYFWAWAMVAATATVAVATSREKDLSSLMSLPLRMIGSWAQEF